MRVITGKYRGRKIASPKGDKIRPTTDKVKESIFTKIQFDIEGAVCLDAFAGTGAIGIECLSRGASEVVFLDKDTSLIKENILGIKDNFKIMRCDTLSYLKSAKKPFDIIFLDPPYDSGLYKPCLDLIFKKSLLKENGIIVCEHTKDENFESEFIVLSVKTYGTIQVTYLTI